MFSLFKKDPREKVVKYIKKNFSKEVSEVLISNLKPCFALDNSEHRDLVVGTSKQSGCPDVPVDFNWPENEGKKLDFILQLNLQEFEGSKIGLPEKGMLYFFLDLTEPSQFPNSNQQYNITYIQDPKDLKRREYEKQNQVDEKALTINEGLSFPGSQSYLLMDLELNDNEFDALINLDYPIISELYGGGIYDIGQLAESDVIDEWVEASEKEMIETESTNKFTGLLSFLLDEWGFADSWVHFGILKEDLKLEQFEKVKISFTST